ncbi:MAG: ATP-binding protein [Nannocystaceae bacterium]
MGLFAALVCVMSIVRAIQLQTQDVALGLLCGDLYSVTNIAAIISWVAAIRALDGRRAWVPWFRVWAGILLALAGAILFSEWIFTNEPLIRNDALGNPFWGHALGPAAFLMLLVGPLGCCAVIFESHRFRTSDRIERGLVLGAGWGMTSFAVLMILRLSVLPGLPAVSEFMLPMMVTPGVLLPVRRQMLLREGLEAKVAARTKELALANGSLRSRNNDLATTLTELEKATAAQARMLANVSHELRTPLHAVIACTQLVEDGELERDQRELVTVARQAGQELSSLIDDLLDAASLDSQGVEIREEVVDVHKTVKQLTAELAPLADAKGLAVAAKVSPRLSVQGDSRRVRQIVRNLVANAIRYTETGSIEVTATEKNRRVAISVKDTGPGIPEADLEAIFEPFRQVERAGNRPQGTGLGLSIARELAKRMGGNLSVTSEVGRGSCFVLTLTSAGMSRPNVRSATLNTLSRYRGRVLVVDDNPTNRMLATRVLQARGLEVEAAVDGVGAIELVQRGFQLVLMDCFMPNMNGFEATKQIRELGGKVARTPIVALTASTLAADVEMALEASMDDHLAKPFDLQALDAVLARYCEQVKG